MSSPIQPGIFPVCNDWTEVEYRDDDDSLVVLAVYVSLSFVLPFSLIPFGRFTGLKTTSLQTDNLASLQTHRAPMISTLSRVPFTPVSIPTRLFKMLCYQSSCNPPLAFSIGPLLALLPPLTLLIFLFMFVLRAHISHSISYSHFSRFRTALLQPTVSYTTSLFCSHNLQFLPG